MIYTMYDYDTTERRKYQTTKFPKASKIKIHIDLSE